MTYIITVDQMNKQKA